MINRITLLLFIGLAFWSCEEENQEGNKPTPVTLTFSDNLVRWTMNQDTDFFRYSLYSSHNENMDNKILIYETQTRMDTTYTLESNEYSLSYQIDVMNLNEYVSSSNVLTEVELDYLDLAWWHEYGAGTENWLLKIEGENRNPVQPGGSYIVCNYIHYYDDEQLLKWQVLDSGEIDTLNYCCDISFDTSDAPHIQYQLR